MRMETGEAHDNAFGVRTEAILAGDSTIGITRPVTDVEGILAETTNAARAPQLGRGLRRLKDRQQSPRLRRHLRLSSHAEQDNEEGDEGGVDETVRTAALSKSVSRKTSANP